MVFGLLVMFTALCISAVAIYYSVAGLAAIFAAAVVPIIIMGGVLEVFKIPLPRLGSDCLSRFF